MYGGVPLYEGMEMRMPNDVIWAGWSGSPGAGGDVGRSMAVGARTTPLLWWVMENVITRPMIGRWTEKTGRQTWVHEYIYI